MKKTFFCILLLGMVWESFGQLVTRKDYDAAFALQAGGEVGALTSFQNAKFSLQPIAGLKMTFPFTRKWFLGTEINYSTLKYSFENTSKADFEINQLHVPLYLKCMLSCNKASILFGVYGSYFIKDNCLIIQNNNRTSISDLVEDWSAGITLGYEYRIMKNLHLMCRLSGGVKEIVKENTLFEDKLFPLQFCITLSYDILKLGKCGCD